MHISTNTHNNPIEQSVLDNISYATLSVGISYGISSLCHQYTSLSSVKRSLIAGGIPIIANVGIYTLTENEAALYGAAGSVVGSLLSAYIYKG